MDIKEIAKEYAARKASSIEQAIADAFEDGYKSSIEENRQSERFIDLGLPSGTLWSRDVICDQYGYIIYLQHCSAQQLNIPTIEQWKELMQHCELVTYYDKNIIVLGRNGRYIKISGSLGYDNNEGHHEGLRYWLKSDSYFCLSAANIKTANDITITREYAGNRFPVILVSSK